MLLGRIQRSDVVTNTITLVRVQTISRRQRREICIRRQFGNIHRICQFTVFRSKRTRRLIIGLPTRPTAVFLLDTVIKTIIPRVLHSRCRHVKTMTIRCRVYRQNTRRRIRRDTNRCQHDTHNQTQNQTCDLFPHNIHPF